MAPRFFIQRRQQVALLPARALSPESSFFIQGCHQSEHARRPIRPLAGSLAGSGVALNRSRNTAITPHIFAISGPKQSFRAGNNTRADVLFRASSLSRQQAGGAALLLLDESPLPRERGGGLGEGRHVACPSLLFGQAQLYAGFDIP